MRMEKGINTKKETYAASPEPSEVCTETMRSLDVWGQGCTQLHAAKGVTRLVETKLLEDSKKCRQEGQPP